ncbi:hypothetical protein P3T36_006753 [Kitasatospora sp. MAP12-15]|uniref:hypothetical protein n=1 Tax=unclassified Kitasatospora TaxID=2633591 RepID=UPI002474CEB2|nr:hypothetical protein [Kitasatospora sp. MAP12-44]MDH6111573.1 hypothetical protein [Kitasatospora sp. MAP12-44]
MTEDQQHGAGNVDPEYVDPEEQALRELLHRAVAGLQPAPDALPRIRHAVPVRRARHRQAWTCAALVAAVLAVALPTLHGLPGLQLSDGSAAGAARPSDGGPAGAAPGIGHPAPVPSRGGDPDADADATAVSSTAASGGVTSATALGGAASGPAGAAPPCARTDLGPGSAQLASPDAAGRVYGVLTVANISGHACLLTDPGAVTVTGGAGPVAVVTHTLGDPADGLPDPATLANRLLLAAEGGYRVAFAWVPDSRCPVTGGAAGSSSDPRTGGGATAASGAASPGGPGSGGASPAADPGGGGSPAAQPSPAQSGTATASASPSASLPTAAGQPSASAGAPGTLVVDHQPLGTGPVAVGVLISGVCGSGTLYRSLPQPAS